MQGKKQSIRITAWMAILICLVTMARAQAPVALKDYLHTPGPIVFQHTSYYFRWSSHPGADAYKQEYIPDGDSLTHYKSMILLDVLTGDTDIVNIVKAKTAELEILQKKNPVVHYAVMNNKAKDEYLLDFLMSENTADGANVVVLERNIYRYKIFSNQAGKKGILLFGISIRSYGDDITPFLADLKQNREILVKEVAQFNIPAVSIGP